MGVKSFKVSYGGAPEPVLSTNKAVEMGLGELDNSAIVKAIAGSEFPLP